MLPEDARWRRPTSATAVPWRAPPAFKQRLEADLQREQVGGLGFAGAQSRLHRFPLQIGFGVLLVDDPGHALGKVTLHPRQRDVALQRGARVGQRGLFACEFVLGAAALDLALLGARKLLHHADLAHGHEIPRKAVAIRPVNRQVVEPQSQLGVRQLARRDGHLSGSIDG
jgi:hypothetical protein